MIDNYELDSNGVLYQVTKTPIKYDEKYSSAYDNYGESTNYMSYMRLGFIVGSMGKVPNSILDVGYGNGSFLKTSSQIIPNCFGYDISGVTLPNHIKTVDNLFDRHYDVITFFDSLEHFEDIYVLDKLQCNYICISVPWCHNFNDEWFEKWKHRRPGEHLWHFSEKSLKCFVESQNYEYINHTNIEDCIRKTKFDYPNILTSVFKKK